MPHPRVRAYVSAAGRVAEGALLRVTRALRGRPEFTIVRTATGPAALESRDRRVEVLSGSLAACLERARGRWIAVVDPTDRLPPDLAGALATAAIRRTALVPVADDGPHDATDLMEKAVLTAGTAFPAATARAVGAPDGDVTLAGERHRARALAQLRRVPSAARVVAPAPSGDGAQAAGASPRELLTAAAALAADAAVGGRTGRAIARAACVLAGRAGRKLVGDESLRRDLADDPALTAVDWTAVNSAAAQKLVIAYTFPPYLDTSGFVAARRLSAQGDAFDVIAQDMKAQRAKDPRALDIVRRDLGSHVLARGPVTPSAWPAIEEYCRFGMSWIEERTERVAPYRELYSRSMWIAPSVLAAWYKSRHPEVRWVAELSDPLTLRTNGQKRPDLVVPDPILDEIAAAVTQRGLPERPSDLFFETVEWMVYALADEIVFTNRNQRELMLSTFPDASLAQRAQRHSVVSAHPVPAEWMYTAAAADAPRRDDRVSLAYFGGFYDVRGPGELLDPIAQLSGEERAQVSLTIFTSGVEKIRAEVVERGLEDTVEVRAALDYFAFLATARTMDWLIVADAHRPENFPVNPYLPSKYADYRGSGARIWGIVDEGSILSTEPLDATSAVGDTAGAAAVLRSIVASAAAVATPATAGSD